MLKNVMQAFRPVLNHSEMNGDIATQSKHSTKERQAPLIFLLISYIKNIKYNRLYLDYPVPLAKSAFNPVDLL